jgi:hypothetical protein
MSPTDKPVTVIFPSGRIAAKIVNLVVHNKPLGASRRSQYPYYKSSYALWIKADIDKMIAEKANNLPLVYDYKIFCTVETNISEITLYARITQAARFLVEQMDDQEGTYHKWYEQIEISKNQKLGGVAIIWRSEFSAGTNLRPRLSEPQVELPRWRRELDEWLEGEQDEPFKRDNLLLGKDVIAKLHQDYDSVQGLFISITPTSITFVKTL